MNNEEAIKTLVRFFNDNKLTFRNIAKLKEVFDEAVEECNAQREEDEAEYQIGRCAKPSLASRDTEDDFFLTLEADVEQSLNARGIKPNQKVLSAITNCVADIAEFEARDFFIRGVR